LSPVELLCSEEENTCVRRYPVEEKKEVKVAPVEEDEFPVMLVVIIAAAVVALCCICGLIYVCVKR